MKKNKINGFLSGMLGTFFVLLGVLGYSIISIFLNRLFIGMRFEGEVAGAIMTMYLTSIVVAFVLYEAIFITWLIKISREDTREGDMNGSMKKLLRIVAAVCIALSLLLAVVSANTFTELREDSINKVCFVTTKSYTWNESRNDVRSYSFVCDENGGITFSVTMKDGETVELLGGVNSISDGFREKYNADKVGLFKYAADLVEQFKSSGYLIEARITEASIENAKKAYGENEDTALLWEQIERIIASATEDEQDEISISIYSLSAYNELFDAVDYTDEELDKFLNTYPECYAYCGITNREELLAFVKLLEAAPLPTITDESLIESFYLEYRTGQNMFDMIYKLGGNRYRFCVWAKSNTFSDSIFADSNATIVSTHMLGNIQIDLYSKGTENVYYDSFELSSYKVEVLAYDDMNNVAFDFSNFDID